MADSIGVPLGDRVGIFLMVGRGELEGRKVFYCEICKLAYSDEATAAACEVYCDNNPACSVEIGRKAVGAVPGPDERFVDWE